MREESEGDETVRREGDTEKTGEGETVKGERRIRG